MSWFNKHLNITWALSALLQFVAISFGSPVPYVVFYLLFLAATVWALNRKKRCWAWFFIPISVLFLSNKREEAK